MDDDWYTPTLTSTSLTHGYPVYAHHDIVGNPSDFPDELAELAVWSTEFLTTPNDDLGRSGSVCPFAHPSMRRGLYFFADTIRAQSDSITDLMRAAKDWHRNAAANLKEKDRELLTLLVPMPWMSSRPVGELDQAQHDLKDEYVREGLMVGQFHPGSDEPGLWNESFRPLRTSTALLAIRFMTPGDVVFLTSTEAHLDAYLERFAPDIPPRARVALTALAGRRAA